MVAGTPWKKLAVLLLFVAGWGLFFALGGGRYLTVEALKANRAALLGYTQSHYWTMLAVTAAVYTAATALSIPGGAVLSMAIGFLFGRWVGTSLIVFAATLGTALVFLAARYVFAEAAQRRMGARAGQIVAGFRENAFNYLLFLRLVPLFPFWLVNLVPAFTGISLRTYVAATALGIIPGSFAFANLGQSLGRLETAGDLLSPETLGAFALLGLLALVPVFVRRYRRPG
jgi:uncharacterized membrane protein YdjX (TVP38/TMEM64 family)